ncbi:MAG: PASTA domain-containing protein [Acidimicrobiia bacterium]|nr:transglycosylase domain-containing protein [Acidimicrobiia bacterium]NNJ47739.1 PASTA domain-containing protein [Acidimicrobiia bacterium]NNL14454.1 PASTA domain-containing protein [Acidimicrobiia bacterium]NNL98103.1 PASTA domain-containing protein [Acidimicrobiia bacterium]
MSLPNPEPTIHQAEWRERRTRLVPALAILMVAGVLMGAWVGLFTFASTNPSAKAYDWVDDTLIPETNAAGIPEFPNLSRLSTLFSADGVQLAELSLRGSLPVPIEAIPEHVSGAILAAEDGDFYTHRGADFESTLRAAVATVRGTSIQGGSTITQQVVRSLGIVGKEKTVQRKIAEIAWAAEMERKYSKDAILEFYLNSVYFGWNAYGIRAAGLEYFGKELQDLSVGEAAALATVIRNPSLYDPRDTTPNESGQIGQELVEERRVNVLDSMVEIGLITQGEADATAAIPLAASVIPHRNFPEPAELVRISAVGSLLNDPKFDTALGTTPEDRLIAIFGCPADDVDCELESRLKGGLKITTTVDFAFQQRANEILRDWLPLNPTGEAAPTGAITTVENGTGAIKVMAGGLDFGDDIEAGQRDYNLATEGQRQPGSSAKPFALIAYLEQGGSLNSYWNISSPLVIECDVPCGDDGGFEWTVRGGRVAGGLRSLEASTYFSTNPTFAQIAVEVGPEAMAEVANRLGVSAELPLVYSLALGAGEVSPLDMAAAYSTIANYGVKNDPYLIERIEDEDGNVLFEATPEPERVLDETLAAVVVNTMKKVVSTGTGTAANIVGRTQAGKTGTNQSFRDAWFVGYVPQYSTAVWVGYADAQIPMTNITINGEFFPRVFGGSVPAPIWKEFMTEFLADVPAEEFPPIPPGSSKYYVVPSTEVPDVLSDPLLTQDEAEQLIYFAHLRPVIEEVPSLEPLGTILSQVPDAGAKLSHNGEVKLEISNGEPPTFPLPNLIGKTRTEANLEMALLAAETEILVALVPEFVPTPDSEAWDKIILTRPPPGTEVGADTIVTIVIGRAPDE